MKGLWWKVLAMLLLLYVFVAGMLVPLKPGITGVSSSRFTTGETATLSIFGYNTSFTSSTKPRVWFRLSAPKVSDGVLSDTALLASAVEVIDAQTVVATFELPLYLPNSSGVKTASIIVDSPSDGPLVLPGGVVLTEPTSLAGPRQVIGWEDQIMGLSEQDGMTYPYRGILGESIRNQYFHVSLWFALMLIMLSSAVYAGKYLRSGNLIDDYKSQSLADVGFLFGILGLVTGMVWANYTWGAPWSGDIKQNMTAIALLIYAAYFILRANMNSDQQQARVGAAYNIFAFVMLIPLLYVIPRMYDSLHPGNGGNPGFGGEDLDNTMRMVFYPGIIGFTLLGIWIAQLRWRIRSLKGRVFAKAIA